MGDIATADLEKKINDIMANKKEYKYVVENAEIIGAMCEELHEAVYQASQRHDFT